MGDVKKGRWSVCTGGPSSWDLPVLETNDAAEAIARYEQEHAALGLTHPRRTWATRTVAIFDDDGEGEPLDPDTVRERSGPPDTILYEPTGDETFVITREGMKKLPVDALKAMCADGNTRACEELDRRGVEPELLPESDPPIVGEEIVTFNLLVRGTVCDELKRLADDVEAQVRALRDALGSAVLAQHAGDFRVPFSRPALDLILTAAPHVAERYPAVFDGWMVGEPQAGGTVRGV